MTEAWTRSRSTSRLKAPRRANGQGPRALQVLSPGHCRCGCKHPHVVDERERYASAKIEDIASNKAVVIEKMIQGEFAAVVAREHFGGGDEVDSVMRFAGLQRLDRVDECDLLCVPGGFGTVAAVEDQAYLSAIRRLGEKARYITSVCTGSLLLAAAGLLRGRRAACHSFRGGRDTATLP